jgi:hypothetical protein
MALGTYMLRKPLGENWPKIGLSPEILMIRGH